jgi:hypothetical protein
LQTNTANDFLEEDIMVDKKTQTPLNNSLSIEPKLSLEQTMPMFKHFQVPLPMLPLMLQ